MKRRILLVIFAISFLYGPVFFAHAATTPAVEYLCELGVTFYRQGKYDDALHEFKKALLIDPENQRAKDYINNIFGKTQAVTPEPPKKAILAAYQPEVPKTAGVLTAKPAVTPLSREEAMEMALGEGGREAFPQDYEIERRIDEAVAGKDTQEKKKLKVSGEAQVSLGVASPQDTIWKRAAFDLNERNWRMLSDAAYNKRFNTYDPRIYDRLSVDLDTNNKEGFNFHTDITIDPWSFTGKSAKQTVTTNYGDKVEYELKYWSNTRYTLNETVYSKLFGNTFAFDEIKVRHNHTDSFPVTGAFADAVTGIHDASLVPETKIYREFQPIRELWFDYNNEVVNFRAFPIAYQDQAPISDDPLAINNHHIWWEDSLWLANYHPGIYNSGATPVDFTQGFWDDHLTFLSRNSEGQYLTALRGFSFDYLPSEITSFNTTVSTPKNLWQDYEVVDNIASSSRLKHYIFDNLSLAGTFTSRTAFDWDKYSIIRESGRKVDQANYVEGLDLGYEFTEGFKGLVEALASQSYFDLTTPSYRTESRGNAYYFAFVGRYPRKSIMDLTYPYDEIKLDKGETFLLKGRFFGSHMDEGFYSALSSYRNTRVDQFWGRHISFRRPFEYYYSGLKYPGLKWDEINAIRIGDGIDFGRDVLGLRLEAICEGKYENLFDVRNVHDVDGKFIENVARDELTLYFGDKLTFKGLYLYQKMPKSYGGIDPFIYDTVTGEFVKDYSSDPIDDGKNCSLNTGSVGAEYKLFDWLIPNGVYERTNDYTLAYGNFPRGVLSGGKLDDSFYAYDMKYRANQAYVYDQQLFPQPPYPFYNIFKFGLRILPIENMEVYLDYTRNEFESAGQIADTMNHIGFEFGYSPFKKFGFLLKYNYARWKDLDRLQAGVTKPLGHHNVFTEFRFLPSEFDEFTFQYGEGNVSPIGFLTFDPYGGSSTTIDTQHIFRFYYRRKF